MRWVRVNRRVGAWAALFALAVQITLSFGHVHLATNALSSSTAAHAAQRQSAERRSPSNPAEHQDTDDFCAICATIALVASSVLPEPAALPPRIGTRYVWARHFATASAARQPNAHFQARAPPFFG